MATLFRCLQGLLCDNFRNKFETYLFGIRTCEAKHLVIVYFACGECDECDGCDIRVLRKRVNFDNINAFSLANSHEFEIDNDALLIRLFLDSEHAK